MNGASAHRARGVPSTPLASFEPVIVVGLPEALHDSAMGVVFVFGFAVSGCCALGAVVVGRMISSDWSAGKSQPTRCAPFMMQPAALHARFEDQPFDATRVHV